MENRILNAELRKKTASVAEAAACIQNGMTVAFGGYTSSGYPKVIAEELARRKAAGEELFINVVSGANNGPLDTLLAKADIVCRRAPMIESRDMAAKINSGAVQYVEQQMSKVPRLLRTGFFGKIDVAVVEALGIDEKGNIIPTSSVGMVPNLVAAAETVIVEINTAQPEALAGLHDIYLPADYPAGKPIPISSVGQRIGRNVFSVDSRKIRFIVQSDKPDETVPAAPAKGVIEKISANLFEFLEKEYPDRRLPPLQTGFGSLSAEIVKAIGNSGYTGIEFFCGGLQEANIELIAQGKVRAASTGSVQMTPRVMELLNSDTGAIRQTLVIRNGEITNSAEVVSRLAPITLTIGIEMDMYGNVNSSHIAGVNVVNGLGGGANFAENAGLSIMLIQSENKDGAVSTIVPMVSHQDICEHDIDVVITENGVAELRGKSDVERAKAIIENCAGRYREQLRDYFDRACKKGGHHPQLLDEAFSWHLRLKEKGTMLF